MTYAPETNGEPLLITYAPETNGEPLLMTYAPDRGKECEEGKVKAGSDK